MRYFLSLLAIALLFSCSTERRAQNKVAWLLSRDLLDDYCARYYPVIDSAGKEKIDTLYLPGQDYTGQLDSFSKEIEAIRQRAESDKFLAQKGHEECLEVVGSQAEDLRKIQKALSDARAAYKPCKPVIITKEVEKWRPDPAEVNRLKGEVLKKDKLVAQAQENTNIANKRAEGLEKWKWWFFGLAGLNLLALIFRLFILKRPL